MMDQLYHKEMFKMKLAQVTLMRLNQGLLLSSLIFLFLIMVVLYVHLEATLKKNKYYGK